MKFRTSLIFFVLVLKIASQQYYQTGQLVFSSAENVKQAPINKIQNAKVLLAINDIDYDSPFSLQMDSRIFPGEKMNLLEVLILTNNVTRYLAQVKLSIRYLIMSKLSGFQIFTFNLTSASSSRTIMPQAASSSSLKRGYFVAGFSSNGLLDLITVTDSPGNFFYMVLNSSSSLDWVKINFVVLDLSPSTGCPSHNLYIGSVNSLNGRLAQNRFSLSNQQNTEIIVALSDLRSFNGTFQWISIEQQSSALAYGSGVFGFVILQLDLNCSVQLSASSVVKSSGTTFNGIKIPDTQGNPIPIPIILPINNNRVDSLNNPNSQTSFWNLNQNKDSSASQNTPIFTPDLTPIDSLQRYNEQFYNNNPQSNTFPTQNPILQTSSTRPETIPTQPTITASPQLVTQPSKSINNVFYDPVSSPVSMTSISAWKILGFVILAWIGISILAIPLLCCLLWRSRKIQNEQDQIIRRYAHDQRISEPAEEFIGAGTDIRLKNNIMASPMQMKQVFTKIQEPQRITYTLKSPPVLQRITESSQNQVSAPLPFQNQVLQKQQMISPSTKIVESSLRYSDTQNSVKSADPQPSTIIKDISQIQPQKQQQILQNSQIKTTEDRNQESEQQNKSSNQVDIEAKLEIQNKLLDNQGHTDAQLKDQPLIDKPEIEQEVQSKEKQKEFAIAEQESKEQKENQQKTQMQITRNNEQQKQTVKQQGSNQ